MQLKKLIGYSFPMWAQNIFCKFEAQAVMKLRPNFITGPAIKKMINLSPESIGIKHRL